MLRSVPLVNGKAVINIETDRKAGLQFNAPIRPGAQIQLYAPFKNHVSISNVAMEFFKQLRKITRNINISNYFGDWSNKELEKYNGLDPSARIGIFIGMPDQVPDFFFDHPFKIGVFVCETDRIADDWVKVCNRMDLNIVPSFWCREAFRNSRVDKPILVVPHGIEPEYYSYKEKVRGDKFIFYNTFHAGSYCSRKSLNELVRCFLIAFEGRNDVVLRLRTEMSAPLLECQQKYTFSPLIEVDEMTSHLSTTEYAKIFSEVHCTVHPSKGEGFGLVPFQSVACETPVIAPHATGMADYLDDMNSIRLKTGGRVAGEGVGNSTGTYFSIDENHLVNRLQYVEENWEYEYDKVKQSSRILRDSYKWPLVLSDFLDIISSIDEQTELERTKSMLTSKYAAITS